MLTYLMAALHAVSNRVTLREEKGQALVEYGLLVGLIAVVCVVVIGTLGGDISKYFQSIVNAL